MSGEREGRDVRCLKRRANEVVMVEFLLIELLYIHKREMTCTCDTRIGPVHVPREMSNSRHRSGVWSESPVVGGCRDCDVNSEMSHLGGTMMRLRCRRRGTP